jgi:hypothetical protein
MPIMKRLHLAVLLFFVACKDAPPASTQAQALPSAPSASAYAHTTTSASVFAADDSGLTLKGAIPAASGGFAMQLDGKYGELRYGHAVLDANGFFVHLTDAPSKCGDWPHPPALSVTFRLPAGPAGDFYAGKVVTTHVEYIHRGYGHVKLDPVDLAEGKHLTGELSFSDPGSGNHNGAVVPPSHGAGRFDVEICPVSAADKLALRPPPTAIRTTPLSFQFGNATSAPKTILVSVEWDGSDREPWVSRVEAFEQANVQCASPFAKGDDMKVYFGLVASDLGTPQPARFEPDRADSQTSRDANVAWIRFEPFDLAAAVSAKGTVVAYAPPYDTGPGATTPEHLPAASLSGTFDAKICRYGSKFGNPYL